MLRMDSTASSRAVKAPTLLVALRRLTRAAEASGTTFRLSQTSGGSLNRRTVPLEPAQWAWERTEAQDLRNRPRIRMSGMTGEETERYLLIGELGISYFIKVSGRSIYM